MATVDSLLRALHASVRNHIVGLEAIVFQQRNSHRFERLRIHGI